MKLVSILVLSLCFTLGCSKASDPVPAGDSQTDGVVVADLPADVSEAQDATVTTAQDATLATDATEIAADATPAG